MRKAVFLDRDGVINKTIFRNGKHRAPDSPETFEFLPGVEEAARLLREAGFVLVVVTNQPDVVRGWQTRENVDTMNRMVAQALKTELVQVCFHDEPDDCDCRKPKPGMLLEAAEKLKIDLKASFMVGDRGIDVAAGHAAGCRSILVGTGCGDPKQGPDHEATSLLEAARWILAQ